MKSLLVALDGSSFADAALPVAVGLARRLQAEIVLASVIEQHVARYATGGAPFADRQLEREHQSEWREAVARYLQGAAARVVALPDAPPVRTLILTGQVADTLLAYADETKPQMIVITTHGRGGLSRAWLGSVCESLLRSAACPIVAVRPADEPIPPGTLPEWTLRRLVVPLDGSAEGEQVVEHIRPLLADDVECVLMRAASPLHPMLRSLATGAEYQRDLAEQRDSATRYLQSVEDALRAHGHHASHCVHVDLDPPRAIADCASRYDAGLVAMATRARNAGERVVFGSVADKVLRTLDRPVLLYRVTASASGA